jgi:murein L,D-transpeptidase YcbB/YkuD
MAAGLCLLLWLIPLAPSAARDQAVQQAIAAAVQALRNDGALTVAGEPLASRIVLPALYEKHDDAPLWSNPRSIEQLLGAIRRSDEEGLIPADYHVVALQALRQRLTEAGNSAPPELSADFDLLLTDSLVRLGYHLAFGKVDPEALDPDWNMQRQIEFLEAVRRLDEAIHDAGVDALLGSLRPALPSYARLIAALRDYHRIAAQGGWRSVPAGPALKPGMTDPRVAALRSRLAASGDLPGDASDSPHFDTPLEAAVRRFQRRHALTVDGVAGKATACSAAGTCGPDSII